MNEPVNGPVNLAGRPSPIRVLVADDQELVRAGFCVSLEAAEGVTVVGEAANGADAVAAVAAQRPDDYDGWASRWLVRWLTEAPEASIDGAVDVAAALAALPLEPQAIDAIVQVGG